MCRICFIFIVVWFAMSNTYAQVTTYFYGRNKVQSKNETAALYSVEIYENNTRVTIELIPTKNRSRMNYWSSINTVIKLPNGDELPIIGFLRNNTVDTAPFSGNWGWDKVKEGQKYYYTLVFDGKIPPGVTSFTLEDKGVPQLDGWGSWYTAHGYGFSGYTLNNPRKGGTSWTEFSVRKFATDNNDGICGIYESSEDNGYKLGCVKQNGEYILVYLGSKEPISWWAEGDMKAKLRASATTGFFKADWIMKDKSIEPDWYIVFDGGSMKTIWKSDEDFYLKMYPTSKNVGTISQQERWSGTGFALNNGYIVTNYHVIENAKSISIQGIKGDFTSKYNATVIATDRYNDLAILQISDNNFNGFGAIPYKVKTSVSEVGEEVFVLGYPLTSTMGDEIKLTTGVISSKTGFQGDVSLYQISAPIQPGNSGGPLFDNKGNLIGVVSAKHKGAENVGYAIKTSYLKNLVESSTSTSILPNNNQVVGQPLTEKVKKIKNYVFMITCSNVSGSSTNSVSSPSFSTSIRTIENPTVSRTTAERAKIKRVILAKDYTAIEITSNNQSGNSYYQWCNIDRNTYILVNGTRYTLTRTDDIQIAPEKTYFSYAGQSITFTLYFPPISDMTTSIDLIESVDSEWKFYGIKIR
ncbi:MAG TPA: serine protease [Candidatus Bacteroides pullicola]|uniref:Serine protease n=1 Tax=Candidatus Bacteroides pullicola TaxID=2838475 RepID=A0A9D1ZGJ8_9BACE|nr:serine protease [Coprobacter fastidiosus]HIY87141.1 serine protease [Candidatus Bacteroides pullicola]